MATKNVESIVLVGNGNGIVIIPSNSPLKRLNYFDGKFLRASDLKDEQNYVRQLVRLSNQAGGSGAVHGFDLTLGGGDTLNLGPGLGIDPQGRVLLLPQEVSMGIQELIDLSLKAHAIGKKKGKEESGVFGDCVMVSDTPPINQAFPGDLYLIVLFPAEALCGTEDVYGKLCEEACATSTDRPFAVEGLIVRAIPLVLQTPLLQSKIVTITSKLYLRSRVASAYFEDERLRVASMISKFGLAQEVWCLGAEAAGGNGLPIGVIARAGETTVFLDAWIARRERMDTPPRRYWQWRMMMRPWDVYMAQILQFQCQLRDLFGDFTPEPEDPCGDAKSVLGEAAKKLADFLQAHKQLSTDSAFQADLLQLETMGQKLTLTEQGMKVVPIGNQWLIQGGLLTLPSAGYLPVEPNGNISVNEQVTRMMGEGVDLRFCIVRPDFVAHALEEAQHMERISLIEGLEDPKLKPEVDILVPEGEFMTTQPATQPGFAVDAKLQAKHSFAGNSGTTTVPDVPFKGVARRETLSSGGTAFYLASSSPATATVLTMGLDPAKWKQLLTLQNPNTTPTMGVWLTFRSDKNLFLLKTGDKTILNGEVLVGTTKQSQPDFRGEINGELTIGGSNEEFPIAGTIDAKFSVSGIAFPAKSGTGKFSFLAKQQGSTLEIVFGHEDNKVQFGIDVDFTNPANVIAKLASKILPNPSSMFEINFNSTLVRNDDVFLATNADHVRAVQALGFIAGALKDPTFVAEKSKLLFPEVGTEQLTGIRATRDWVLFHRRRNKNCGTVAVTTRSYRVYQRAAVGVADDEGDLFPKQPPTKEELLALTAKDVEGINPIGVVTFGGGVATLVGDSSAVKNAWQKIPGGKIVWGAIASSGDALNDGDALATSRVKNLESILDQVDPSARVDVLPIVPPPLASTDVDGVIILINAAAPAPPPSANLRINKTAVLGQNAAGGRTITFNLEVVNDGPSPANDVKVNDPTPANTTLQSRTAPAGWATSGPVLGGTGTVVFQKPLVAPGESANFQIVLIISANFTSGNIVNIATVDSATSDPDQQNNTAKTTTILIPGTPAPTQRTAVVVFTSADGKVAANSPVPLAKVVFQNNVPQGDTLKSVVGKVLQDQQVISVRVAALGAPIDSTPAAQQRQNEVIKALNAGAVPVLADLQKPIGTLPESEKPALGLTNPQQLVGVQEVIVLGLSAFKP